MRANATYTLHNHAPQPASVQLLADKLQIDLRTQAGEVRTVYWYYDQIVQDSTSDFVFVHTLYPPQMLVLQSVEGAHRLTQQLHKSKKKTFTQRRSLFLKVATGGVLLLMAIYFFVMPALATHFAERYPVNQEKELGESLYRSLANDFEIDEQKTTLINQFYQQLNIPSVYNIKLTVVKSDVANAFALPGGHIVVYDKIIKEMHSYPELAALLTHEFTHVQKRHSLKSLFRGVSSSIFFTLLLGDAGAASSLLIGQADNLKSLSYSRRLEREADENGVRLLAQRGIDCKGFVRLFHLLKKENTAEVSEWVSSHPNLDNRIKNIQQNSACRTQQAKNDTTLQRLFVQLKTT